MCIRDRFTGIPYLMMCAKVQKVGSVLLMGLITGLIYYVTGQFLSLIHISAGCLHLPVSGRGPGVADILPHSIVKEEHLLIHHGDLLQHPFCRHGLNGLPSDGDLAALWFVVFGDQIDVYKRQMVAI